MEIYNLRHNVRVKVADRFFRLGGAHLSNDIISIEIDKIYKFEEKYLRKISKEVGVYLYKKGSSIQIKVPRVLLSQVVARCYSIKEIQHIAVEVQEATQPLSGRIMFKGRSIDFSKRSLIMGILNVTPDSFYPSSRTPNVVAAVDSALRMIEEGADIIDVGGESTRPGSLSVSTEEEIRRIIPVIEAIASKSQIPISVDTNKGSVAKAALEAGASMINDVSGLSDNSLLETVIRSKIPVVVMHSRGTPETMQKNVHFEDTIREVLIEIKKCLNRAYKAGLSRKQVIVDPGIGFGKNVQDNLRILGNLSFFQALGPVMIGLSRKSFLGKVLALPVEDRLMGTSIAHTMAVMQGANILRVHDVAAAFQVVGLVSAVENICAN